MFFQAAVTAMMFIVSLLLIALLGVLMIKTEDAWEAAAIPLLAMSAFYWSLGCIGFKRLIGSEEDPSDR